MGLDRTFFRGVIEPFFWRVRSNLAGAVADFGVLFRKLPLQIGDKVFEGRQNIYVLRVSVPFWLSSWPAKPQGLAAKDKGRKPGLRGHLAAQPAYPTPENTLLGEGGV